MAKTAKLANQAVAAPEAPWYDSLYEEGKDYLKKKGTAYIKTQAKSLLVGNKAVNQQPAAGYQSSNPYNYDDYLPTSGGVFSGPTYGSGVQAAQVGGVPGNPSYS